MLLFTEMGNKEGILGGARGALRLLLKLRCSFDILIEI